MLVMQFVYLFMCNKMLCLKMIALWRIHFKNLGKLSNEYSKYITVRYFI